MFAQLFRSRPSLARPGHDAAPPAAAEPRPRGQPRSIRRGESLVGATLASRELLDTLMQAMRDSRGVHAESLLTALAALAGHACQASVRAEFIDRRGLAERQVLVAVETQDGSRYYLGELIDRNLFDDRLSVWHLVAHTAQSLGVNPLPQPAPLVAYAASTFGAPEFGVPRWPEGHRAADTPYAYLQVLWAPFRRVVDRHCDRASDWPLVCGLALQQAMTFTAQALAPALALQIVLEVAVPMSRVRLPATAEGSGAEAPVRRPAVR